MLVGPATPAGRLPLAGLPNVHLAGPVPYKDAPAFVRGLDVGLIPYRVGGRVDYVHPKKCYEYLATGIPVVATPLPALTDPGRTDPARRRSGGVRRRHNGRTRRVTRPGGRKPPAAVGPANTWRTRGAQLRGLLAELPGGAALSAGAAALAKTGPL